MLATFSFTYTKNIHEEFLCEELIWKVVFWNLLSLVQLPDGHFTAELELYDYLLVLCVWFFFSFFFFLFLFWEPHVWHAFFSLLWGYFWVPFPTLIYSAKAWDCYSSQKDRKNHSWKSSWKFHLSLAGPLRLWSDEMELSQFKESLSQPTPLLGLCLFPPPTPGMHSLFSV